MEEGLKETLTLHRLGVNGGLADQFVQRDRELFLARGRADEPSQTLAKGDMRSRWVATMLLVAEQGLRRIKGYRHLADREKALRPTQSKTMLKAA